MKINLLNNNQEKMVSGYLADISKIACGSLVINFFVINPESQITVAMFVAGCILTLVTLGFSIQLSK